MTLYEYLIDKYGYNEPILSSEITFRNYSKAWIFKELNRLCDEKQLLRFEKGIYYIPTQTVLGLSVLNPQKVIEKKYVQSGGNVFGYYSGQTFLNKLGLSTQMPNVVEIYTNNESAKVRDINVGNLNVRLRRSRVTVNNKNVAALSFLELMNSFPADFMDEYKRRAIDEYISKNNISRADITKYAPQFPDKAMRNMIESEVIYSVTQ